MSETNKTGKLLEVKDLKVSFFTDLGETQAVKGADRKSTRLNSSHRT